MTTIRQAILKAADHIERNPDEFDFSTNSIPASFHCGSPGCALGWIGCNLGEKEIGRVAKKLGHGFGEFLSIIDKLDVYPRNWHKNHLDCAIALRLYADKYHPAETSTQKPLPASVTDIFKMSPEALYKELVK